MRIMVFLRVCAKLLILPSQRRELGMLCCSKLWTVYFLQ